MAGIVPLTAAGAIGVGQALRTDAEGKLHRVRAPAYRVASSATYVDNALVTSPTNDTTVACALEAATQDGDLIRCMLIPN